MIPWWYMAALAFGINFMVWGGMGLLRGFGILLAKLRRGVVRFFRSYGARVRSRRGKHVLEPFRGHQHGVEDVAVLIPAHNEELVLGESLASVLELVPRDNVHVVSDGSTDRTVEIARQFGVHVLSTYTNVGKAGALREAIERFELVRRYPLVLLLDADTRLESDYFSAALPMFADRRIVAVAGFVRSDWDRKGMSLFGKLLVSHRQRIYALTQYLLKFGQTWRRCNATHIVPGFASVYRTDILPYIDMNPPGLVIEDFNMTFEVYQKGLGKVGFTPSAVAVTQDPGNLRDYVRQTKRWALGLWQTVRRHRPKPNLFTCMLALLLLELITSSVLMVLLPVVVIVLAVPRLVPAVTAIPGVEMAHEFVATYVSLFSVLLGVVLVDLTLTLMVAIAQRHPRFLIYGAFYLPLRVLDAGLSLYTLPVAWLTASTGRWHSPGRRVPVLPPARDPIPTVAPEATTARSAEDVLTE